MFRDRPVALLALLTLALGVPALSLAADQPANYPDYPTTPVPTTPRPTTPDPTTPTTPAPVIPTPVTPTPLVPQVTVTPAPTTPASTPAPRVRLLAVGSRLGGKKKNLLTVKFTMLKNDGLRIRLVIPAIGGKAETLLSSALLTASQAKAGTIRLKLSAKSRKLVKAIDGKGMRVLLTPLDATGKPFS